MADEKPPKPPSPLTQIPAAALPKFGFELKEALALERVQKSPEAQARRAQEEEPARKQAEFARYLADTGKINEYQVREGEENISPGESLPPPPVKPSGKGR
jgi:hypothetical protein